MCGVPDIAFHRDLMKYYNRIRKEKSAAYKPQNFVLFTLRNICGQYWNLYALLNRKLIIAVDDS